MHQDGSHSPVNTYVIIEKTTGTAIHMDDSVTEVLGERYGESATPSVELGHCVLTAP